MAVNTATRIAVITRRGRVRAGLARSAAEADRWLQDAIEYQARGPLDRAVVSVTARPGGAFPRIRVRRGTPCQRVDRWLPATPSSGDPRQPVREAALARLPASRAARTLIVLRTGIVVCLLGPASEAGRPLDGFLRLRAAADGTSLEDVVLVMHVPERLDPWIAASPADAAIERF